MKRIKKDTLENLKTLRDQFAGQALCAMAGPAFNKLIDDDATYNLRGAEWARSSLAKDLSLMAYCIADAMLAERDKEE